MEVRVPNKQINRWTGPYLGNYQGDLWRTFNIDLERSPGHIGIPFNFKSQGDTGTLANLGVIDNYTRTNADGVDRWWGLSRAGRLFKTDSNNPLDFRVTTWVQDTLVNTPTNSLDMTIHENDSDSVAGENLLLVTRVAEISALNDSAGNDWNDTWWGGTKAQTALKSSVPHPIEYFPFQRVSVIGDGNLVHTIDKSKAISYARVVLPVYLRIWGIVVTPFRCWFLCEGLQGRNGAIVEWDGYSQSYNYIHDAQSSHALSGVNYYGNPIVVNSRGLILEYNGSSFYPMIRNGQKMCFPGYEESDNSFLFPNFGSNIRPLNPRGMDVTDDGLIYINIQGPFFASGRQLAGVWCLNPEEGRLYLKHSLSVGNSTDFGHQLFNATGSGVGAIKSVGPECFAYLLGGGQIFSTGTTTAPNIWVLLRNFSSQYEQRGFFITQFIHSDEIKDKWDNVWLELSPFRNTTYDKIVVKARGVNPLMDSNRLKSEETVTWTSTTTFTVTISNSNSDALAIGDEIEVLSGRNAGILAHITNISGAHAALQTVTIDETVPTGSGSSKARFDRWKKLGVIDSATKYNIPMKIGIDSSFIQFKVELRGFPKDFEIKALNVSSVKQTKTKK